MFDNHTKPVAARFIGPLSRHNPSCVKKNRSGVYFLHSFLLEQPWNVPEQRVFLREHDGNMRVFRVKIANKVYDAMICMSIQKPCCFN